jgi:hypothetical protein
MRVAAAALLLAIGCAPGTALAQAANPAPSTAGAPFTFTVPQSRVVVTVPDTSLRPDGPPSSKPNYFMLARRDPLLIVSGWLEPAAGYKGLAEFWQSESRSPALAGALAPLRVEMLREGRWEVVAYDVALPSAGGGMSFHLRAERVEAGTWIDLHLSTVAMGPSATSRADLLAALRRIQVSEKPAPRSQ